MAAQFKPGDVVQLKSGGPKMTVKNISSNGEIVALWFAGAKQESGSFPPETLLKVDDSEE
jgi:uncharacterized protein YodC (DUF2158 family)